VLLCWLLLLPSNRERERRDWEAREEARLAAEAETAARREAHKAAIKELSAQTQVSTKCLCVKAYALLNKALIPLACRLDAAVAAAPSLGSGLCTALNKKYEGAILLLVFVAAGRA
jgi:hypothetical protein